MNIFQSKQLPVTKESIEAKSQGALGMFRSAIQTLEESNAEALNLATENQKIIDKLNADNAELNAVTIANDNVITKISALIS